MFAKLPLQRMRKRSKSSAATSELSEGGDDVGVHKRRPQTQINYNLESRKRSAFVILALFVLIAHGSWAVYHYQFEILPEPLTAERAGKRGFSEEEALKHVKALTELGPHHVGSDALDYALQYVLAASENIRKMAHWEVDVQVDFFNANPGANSMVGGLFRGKSLVYADLSHVVLRISPKYASELEDNAILVSSHIDSVISGEGAGDCSSCVAVMLELARGISQWAHGFKNAIIFLFNTGEEEGLNGAHSFITQHPWSSTIRMAIDLEAMGVGGTSGIFQAGPQPWAIENYAMVAKYPSGQILAQDFFTSGAISSATDFQVYKEVGGLSGLDFAYADNTAVYHTKNDKLNLLKPGSLQHLGENMLAFLLQAGASSHLSEGKEMEAAGESALDTAIYFDILGTYMIVYRQRFANMIQNSVLLQSLLIWVTSLLIGGHSAVISLTLSWLSIFLMWICSLSFSALVAFILPVISSSPVPFISSPWLVVGLFVSPALLGALTGQHLGFLILKAYLSHTLSKREFNLSPLLKADLVKLDAERWLYKAGLLQWFFLLAVGSFYRIGSSYLALVWLVSPAFSYGLLEATLSPGRLPKPLKTLTLLLGLSVPFIISAGIFIRLATVIIGSAVRFERNPGSQPEWLGSIILSAYIAAVVCLTLVYLLSYVHVSGAKSKIFLATCILFGISIAAVVSGAVLPFTEDTARAVNVVHVVETTGGYDRQEATSYISLFSATPGKLTKEVEEIGEDFVCGRNKTIDFVTFSVHYGCWIQDGTEIGWSKSDIPTVNVESDTLQDDRITEVKIDTKISTRWSLAINTNEIEDFRLKESLEELIPLGDKSSVDGWHIIQFSGGKKAPTKFSLTLFWGKNYSNICNEVYPQSKDQLLLKLRTDVDRLTPTANRVVSKLPPWCSLFGKSTSPHTLAFITNLPVNF